MRVGLNIVAQPLVRAFPVSHMTTESVDVIRLDLFAADGSVTGTGEVSADRGHGQDSAVIADEATALATALAAEPDLDPDRLGSRLAAAAAGGPSRTLVEMAFLDHLARAAGLPVWKLLGLPEPGLIRLMTTVPIGDPVPPITGPLKIKLGGPGDEAVLRGLTGRSSALLLDVNRGWDRAAWERLRPLVVDLAPAVLEDPVDDADLLAEVRRAMPHTAVVLDEGIDDHHSVERAVATADGANVKVMKLGGLLAARRSLEYLHQHGAVRMLGCYLEPPRSIAYAAQLGALCDWTDLDGHFWLSPQPAVTEFRLDSRAPGIPRIAS